MTHTVPTFRRNASASSYRSTTAGTEDQFEIAPVGVSALYHCRDSSRNNPCVHPSARRRRSSPESQKANSQGGAISDRSPGHEAFPRDVQETVCRETKSS